MLIRTAMAADAAALSHVFFDAVRLGPSPYTPAERVAWIPAPPDPDRFAARLATKHVVLAEASTRIVGFMTVETGGYIDLVFILAEFRGRGLFRRLFNAVETHAGRTGETRLSTHASLMAQPAFRAVGFEVIQHETIEYAGQHLRRAEMEKHLT